MENYQLLTQAGIDMEDLLKRLMGNTALVGMFIQKFTQDQNFEQLKQAFADQDMQQAEMKSHTLKGMCGNLSIGTLYPLFTEQTNLIRSGNHEKAHDMMPEITRQYTQTIDCMTAWLAQQ